MKWSRRRALAAGLALIILTNVVALGGAAYNRAGEPDSMLILTERELRPPYAWAGNKENSGLTLRLRWRVLSEAVPRGEAHRVVTDGAGTPAWLDARKMAQLGFGLEESTGGSVVGGGSRFQRQLPRDVLLVLELDGPAYKQAVERATQAGGEAQARLGSRLFVVDAGLDSATLRRQYPDRSRYAIVRGQVRPVPAGDDRAGLGMIQSVSAEDVNVPLHLRNVFAGVAPEGYVASSRTETGFTARLAFGRRLEPWLISATRN